MSVEHKTHYSTSTFQLTSDANYLPSTVVSTISARYLGFSLRIHQQHHIVVILPTATLDNRLEAPPRVTDTYLPQRQRQLREQIRQEPIMPETDAPHPEPASPAPIHPFLKKFYCIVEEYLDDTSFSVEKLADQLNMSRVHLHRKLKTLTGLPASNLIRNYRLKRATQLLRQGLNSSESAYQVGFDSPQYFAKCFRDFYQMTPTEFAQTGQAIT